MKVRIKGLLSSDFSNPTPSKRIKFLFECKAMLLRNRPARQQYIFTFFNGLRMFLPEAKALGNAGFRMVNFPFAVCIGDLNPS
ncbi:MAG: hypothetical protein ACU833_13735, partial [Gammaproteobacteria bacterium]